MSAPNVLPFGPRDSAIERQVIVDTLHQMLDGHTQLDGFPDNLKLALEGRIWEADRVFPGGTRQGPMTLHAFVHEHYPAGLGASYAVVERLIAEREDVLLVWTKVSGRGQGCRTDLVSNVHEVGEERPAGNTKEAGLRKLEKAASEGNEDAAAQLAEVMAGTKKVHSACVDAGLRKATSLDSDVKVRCAKSAAEWIVGHLGQDDPSPLLSDLFALGGAARRVAIEIKNIVGEGSVMDRAGWDR